MKKTGLFTLVLMSASCLGQSSYTIPLVKANTSLSLPAMTAGEGVLYEAHRSFNLLRFSTQLQVAAYDLTTHKELRHAVVNVPRVHGARASAGLFLSPDKQWLVYAELHDPALLLVLSAKDLSEVRRTNSLPFLEKDRHRVFAGFDQQGFVSLAAVRADKLRFIRLTLPDIRTASDVTGPEQRFDGRIIWSPKNRITWIELPGDEWREYHEDGTPTGQELRYQGKYSAFSDASITGEGDFIAFYGNMMNKGAIVVHGGNHTNELELECVPHPYDSGDIAGYAGVLCTTSPDRAPEHGGNSFISSEFLLVKANVLTVVWRHPIDFLTVADSSESGGGLQFGSPLLYGTGSKIVIVAPSKTPALTVYEVAP